MTVHKTKLANRNPNAIAIWSLTSHWIVHHPHRQWMTTCADLPIQREICIGDYVICDRIAGPSKFSILDVSDFTQSRKMIFKYHLYRILFDKIEAEHPENRDLMDCPNTIIDFEIVEIDVCIILSWKSIIKTYIISATKITNWMRTGALLDGCTFSSRSITWIISGTFNGEIKPANILLFGYSLFCNAFIADLGFT
jgi:hypothetical protein